MHQQDGADNFAAVQRWLFIAPASPSIGFGHVSRTKLLATEASRRGVSVDVVTSPGCTPANASELGPRWHEADLTRSALLPYLMADPPPSIVVVDAPDASLDQLAWVRDHITNDDGPLLVAFRINGRVASSVVFEHVGLTPSFENPEIVEMRHGEGSLRHWSGRDLIFVRPSCFVRDHDEKDKPPCILVTMGGADPLGLTRLACQALKGATHRARVSVVLGTLNPAAQAIETEFGEHFEILHQGQFDFDDRLKRASMAVINAGLTRYECIAAGTPFIAVSMDAQQANFTDLVVNEGFGAHAGLADAATGTRVAQTVEAWLEHPELLVAMRRDARDLVDPANASRFIERLDAWRRARPSACAEQPPRLHEREGRMTPPDITAPAAEVNAHAEYVQTFVVAELSANHNHDLELAKATIDAIAATGADAVKFQTYLPESLTLDLADGHFAPRSDGLWKGWRPYDLYRQGSLPYDWHEALFDHVRRLGMIPFSTPFDLEGVRLLEAFACPIYKVASLEINHLPLIEAIAATGKPIVLSTGAASLADIEEALDVIGRERRDVTLLKCTTAYPTPFAEVDLKSMQTLATTFGAPVGLSDHTPGNAIAVAAVALGASMIEKHVTLDRSAGGIDAEFSMEPDEFRVMVDAIRAVEQALGSTAYRMSPSTQTAHTRTRSIFVAEPIRAGDTFTESNLRVVRPGAGLHPRYFARVIGARSVTDLAPGTPLAWRHIDETTA